MALFAEPEKDEIEMRPIIPEITAQRSFIVSGGSVR
jgi:hypothetical protein